MAIQAALTGHLVFSTLHTNDAAAAVTRLADLGGKGLFAKEIHEEAVQVFNALSPEEQSRMLGIMGSMEQTFQSLIDSPPASAPPEQPQQNTQPNTQPGGNGDGIG